MNEKSFYCPICHNDKAEPQGSDFGRLINVRCPRCGTYDVTGTAFALLERGLSADSVRMAALSHAVRTMQFSDQPALLNSDNIEVLADRPLPGPQELIDNLIVLMAQRLKRPGDFVRVNNEEVIAIIGALDAGDLNFAVSSISKRGFVEQSGMSYQLTLAGWQRYEELMRSAIDSHEVFMAMPFGNDLLDQVFRDHWKPAVAATGFELRRLDDGQRAGLIDDRLRVEIRRSRFLVSEITEQNRGAYWEAGFAEGLGRPVIYTCKQSEFDKTHFDTNHHLTILWEEDALDIAVEQLKACIRQTLPAEAVMVDP